MNIGFIGLGKLGLPCAMAMESSGHRVVGYDPSPAVVEALRTRHLPYREAGADELIERTAICVVSVAEVVRESDVIFVAVQTPHGPMYEGVTPTPDVRSDFHYGYLCDAVSAVVKEMIAQQVERTLVIISTVLPGTVRRYIRPILQSADGTGARVHLVYNPFFIAMGTTIHDLLHPEFVLLGDDDGLRSSLVAGLYASLHDRPLFWTTVENAELIKVAYNTFIGMKIVFGNTIMEICHKTPNTDCDEVIDALSLATDRLISPRYLRGGMGDAGGCHPRDQIALSWLAKKLSLSHDLFDDVMRCRDDQTEWLAELIIEEARSCHLPIVLLGRSFKPETDLDVGSCARLLSYMLDLLRVDHVMIDPSDADPRWREQIEARPALYFVSTKHAAWKTARFADGSIVIDPFRYLHDNPYIFRCRYIPVGIGP